MGEPDADQNIGALLGQLVEDGKGLARAELGYYYAIARTKLREIRNSLWLGAVALGLVFAAMIALIVGAVLTLTPLVGPGFATLIVVGVSLALAALAACLAWLQVKHALKDRP